MDIDKLDGLRAYAFRYATGILWLLALLVFVGPPDYQKYFLPIKTSIPDNLFTILAIALGVVIPYATATAVMPLSVELHRLFLQRERAFLKYLRKKYPDRYPSRKPSLRDGARKVVKARLGINYDPQDDELLVFVTAANPSLAALLEMERREMEFREAAIFPTSALIGVYASHIHGGLLSGVTLGLLALIVGIVHAEKGQTIWLDKVDAAVILVASTRVESAP